MCKLFVLFHFRLVLKRFSLMELINNERGGKGQVCELCYEMLSFRVLEGNLKCNCYLTALKMQSIAAVQHNLCVFLTESLGFLLNQLHGFKQLRPVSRLKKACLHDTMIKLCKSSYSLGTVVFLILSGFHFAFLS